MANRIVKVRGEPVGTGQRLFETEYHEQANGKFAQVVHQDDSLEGKEILLGVAGDVFTSSDQSAAPAAVISAPGSGLKAHVVQIVASSPAAEILTFTEETSGDVLAKIFTAAGGVSVIDYNPPLELSTANKRVMVQAASAGDISVSVRYFVEA